MEAIPLIIEKNNYLLCENEDNMLSGGSLMLATSMIIINLYEERSSYQLRATTSNFSDYVFTIEIQDHKLFIFAEKSRCASQKIRKKMPFGIDTFSKHYPIPKTVEIDKIKVYNGNGFITIHMPKWKYVF